MELDRLARVLGVAVFLPQGVTFSQGVFPVRLAVGVLDDVEGFRLGIVPGDLHPVVPDDVDGKAGHLPENAQTRAGADHQKPVFLRETFQNGAVFLSERRAVLG